MIHIRGKSNGLRRHIFIVSLLVVAALALIMVAAAPNCWAHGKKHKKHKKQKMELEDSMIIVEVNSTDGDAGFQIFLDGEGWKNISIYDPNWRQIFNVKTKGGVKDIGGGTELFVETAEPEYGDLDELQELLDLLPEGTYSFFGRTVEGEWLTGEAELTHVIPAGPVITSPVPNGECAEDVALDDTVISWDPVMTTIFDPDDNDIEIVGYQVIVEDEEGPHTFEVTLPAETTSITIPEEFLEPGTEYKFEVLAIEESGNQTITEGCLETAAD